MIEKLRAALADRNVQAFLRVIRAGEGTSDPEGYRRHFGGETFEDFSRHPNRVITKSLAGKQLSSTAAGAYQFLGRTWSECQAALGLPDFSPASQDLAAVFLIARRKGLEHILAGRLEQAIAACAAEWASLPGSTYGQPVKSMAQCRAVYEAHGGTYGPAGGPEPTVQVPTPQPDAPAPAGDPTQYSQEGGMPVPIAPVVAALAPTFLELLPKLGAWFSSGSKSSERNLAVVGEAIKLAEKTVGAVNALDAVEKMQSDPAARTAVEKAVEANWYQLTEAGGGGIAAARAADQAVMFNDGPWWQVLRSPSFLVAIGLLPLVYMIVGAVVGLFGAPFSEDVRAAIANGIVGLILGGLIGYYYGQTTTRNRTPPAP